LYLEARAEATKPIRALDRDVAASLSTLGQHSGDSLS
jgi:hypothetical protein